MLPDEELVDDGTDADFDAGFSGTPTEKKPPEAGAAPATETTAGDGKGEQMDGGAAAVDAVPPAPKYVQLTETELNELRAAAARTASYDSQFSRINGILGNLRGKPAAEKTAEPPPKGTAEPAPPVDTDAAIRTRASEAIVLHEVSNLATEHPNWREIVGAPDKDGIENVDPKHPFRVWLAAQPVEYQAKINGANSAFIISRAIDKFNDDTAKAAAKEKEPPAPSPRVEQRRAVIRNAQQPRGDGGAPPPSKTEDDHFAEGFASG